eukprot:XP_017947298.1 PREDICTED: tetraspanin-18-like [Xenopus tropicalis]
MVSPRRKQQNVLDNPKWEEIFFVLVLLFFIMELTGVILALSYQKTVKQEQFLVELQRFYKGDNASEVFSQSWNTIMIALSCCGISGLNDFGNRSHFHEMYPSTPWPDACCRRDNPVSGKILDREKCMQNTPDFTNDQGCFMTIARGLKKYISISGAISSGVLVTEIDTAGSEVNVEDKSSMNSNLTLLLYDKESNINPLACLTALHHFNSYRKDMSEYTV